MIGTRTVLLTRLFETLSGWSSMFRLHGFYHDVFERVYLKTKKGPGQTYVFGNFKGSRLFVHLTELFSCILFEKNIRKMIVNRI